MDGLTFCSCGMQSCRAPCALPAFLPLPVHQKTSWFLPHSINNVGWMVLLSVLAGCSYAAFHAQAAHSRLYQFIKKLHGSYLSIYNGWMFLLSVLAGCSYTALHAQAAHSRLYQFIKKFHRSYLVFCDAIADRFGFLLRCFTAGNLFLHDLQRLCCSQLMNDSQWMSTSDSYCARTISVQDLHFFPAFLSLLLAYILHQHPSKV